MTRMWYDEITMKKGFISIPLAIVIAGVVIAAAVIYAAGKGAVENRKNQTNLTQTTRSDRSNRTFRPISADDHIRGNPDAAVKIIEYSDTECPFCKQFHPVLQQIVAAYGGKAAWVYRHFPIAGLHPKAAKEAEATECAAELGGEDAFWRYLDRLFEVTPSNNGLDPAELPRIAEFVGLNRSQFETCLASGRHAGRVQKDLEDAFAAGADGTPYSVVVTKSGAAYPFSGALPYEAVKTIVDGVLKAE